MLEKTWKVLECTLLNERRQFEWLHIVGFKLCGILEMVKTMETESSIVPGTGGRVGCSAE